MRLYECVVSVYECVTCVSVQYECCMCCECVVVGHMCEWERVFLYGMYVCVRMSTPECAYIVCCVHVYVCMYVCMCTRM